MKKQELLKFIDSELLEKLFGFCYTRTNDSYEAEELCSDIIFSIIKASRTDGDISNVYPFIWKIAHNVYADFSEKRRKNADTLYDGDPNELLMRVPTEDTVDDSYELLTKVYQRIAFLTKAYRDVMVMFYIDGLTVKEIAKLQSTSEVAVRQRLFSARKKIKSEVEEMNDNNKPIALDDINFIIWGTGSPGWGDPRNGFCRKFSTHIVWLCRNKPMSASEIAKELNVPTVYVEEELEILAMGSNGEYGLLRRLENGKYAINFVLLEKDVFEKANELYTQHLPKICDTIIKYIETHKEEYLSYPYLNKKVDMNLIMWQQIQSISYSFSNNVERVLRDKHFNSYGNIERPFSVFGYVDNGKYYGGGCDGISAENICGYTAVHIDNIYITRIKKHFHCGHNISKDPQLQLAIKAIKGLAVSDLSDKDKEHAAKAIESGYLYREDDKLYTKILVSSVDNLDVYKISKGLREGYFEAEAESLAAKIAELIKKSIPEYLYSEWELANSLANMPILDAVVEYLIEKGVMTAPEDGIGAEGCWMFVEE